MAIEIIQKCELGIDSYSKDWFIKLIGQMSDEQFTRFCKEVAHMEEHYASTVGCFATDIKSVFINNEKVMWEIKEIDFNSPVNFRTVNK